MVVKRVALNERIVVTHRVVACIGCLLKLLWKEYSYTWKKFVEGPMHARQKDYRSYNVRNEVKTIITKCLHISYLIV
jgi:hypothetical protein